MSHYTHRRAQTLTGITFRDTQHQQQQQDRYREEPHHSSSQQHIVLPSIPTQSSYRTRLSPRAAAYLPEQHWEPSISPRQQREQQAQAQLPNSWRDRFQQAQLSGHRRATSWDPRAAGDGERIPTSSNYQLPPSQKMHVSGSPGKNRRSLKLAPKLGVGFDMDDNGTSPQSSPQQKQEQAQPPVRRRGKKQRSWHITPNKLATHPEDMLGSGDIHQPSVDTLNTILRWKEVQRQQQLQFMKRGSSDAAILRKKSPRRSQLVRKSSLEELAEHEEAVATLQRELAEREKYVRMKQRELQERGIIPDGQTATGVIEINRLRYEEQTHEQETRPRRSSQSNKKDAQRRAEAARLTAKLDDFENEIDQLRARTQDIQDKVNRLEMERQRNNRAPDVISMLRGGRNGNDSNTNNNNKSNDQRYVQGQYQRTYAPQSEVNEYEPQRAPQDMHTHGPSTTPDLLKPPSVRRPQSGRSVLSDTPVTFSASVDARNDLVTPVPEFRPLTPEVYSRSHTMSPAPSSSSGMMSPIGGKSASAFRPCSRLSNA